MVDRQWLDRLQTELRRRNLPADYSARLIEELTDHFTEIQMEDKGMDAHKSTQDSMGAPDVLASAAEIGFFGRSFASRHPLLAFVVCPVPAAFLMLIAIIFLIVLPSEWIVAASKAESPAAMGTHFATGFEWSLAYLTLYILRFAPFGLTAFFFARMARHANKPAWGLAACACVAGFAYMFRTVIEPPTDRYALMLRVGLDFEHGLHQWQNGLVQMAVPLLLGVWAWRRRTPLPRRECAPMIG